MKPLVAPALMLVATAAMARPAPLGRDRAWQASAAGNPHPAVVRVIVPDRVGSSLGSGALVAVSRNLGLVVTNWHVVRDAKDQIVVAFPGGFRSGATVLGTDRDWDLAALAIWRPNVDPIPLATQPPLPGEPLTIAGYGKGSYRAITGRCTQYVAPGRSHPFEMVELSAGARQGDSGGPIFNSRGELAGVLFGAAWGRTTGSYCGRVRQFLTAIADDFQRLDGSSTMIAQRPPPSATPIPGQRRPAPAAIARRTQTSAGRIAERSPPDASQTGAKPTRTPLPVVSIPARTPGTSQSSMPQPRGVSPGAGWRSSLAQPGAQSALAPPESTQLLRWEEVAGSTRSEQIKTLLAAVGLLAIFFHALQLLSKSPQS